MEAIEKAKILLGLTDFSEDTKLETLLELIEEEILEYTYLDSIATISVSLLTKMLVFKYNKLNQEHINSNNFEGVSESYITDYPKDIIKSLDSYKIKLRCF